MMKESRKREIIQEIIEEVYGSFKGGSVIGGDFPYDNASHVVPPNEIDTNKNYLVDKSSAENNDTYVWPQKEFDLGMKVEKKRTPDFNMFDHADMVINNLRKDRSFYSKLS